MVSCFFQGLSFNAYFVSRAILSTLGQNTNVVAVNDKIAAAGSKGDVMSSRILIVDEDEATIELLTANVKEVSNDIRGLTDSRQVEHVFAEFKPDLVLLDLHMPQRDGLEVLRSIRGAREALGYLPVIVLTADSSRMARNSALILGANDFITKPFDRWEVILRVRNLLHTRHLYEDLRKADLR